MQSGGSLPLLPLAVALVIVVWLHRKKRPDLLLGCLVFVAGFLPTSGLIPFTFQEWSTVADRYLYLSMLGPALIWGCLTQLKPWLAWALVPLTVLCLVQVPLWENEITLWGHCVKTTPKEARVYNNLGVAWRRQGDSEKALTLFNQAIAFDSSFGEFHCNRAAALMDFGQYDQALGALNKSIKLQPWNEAAFINRGITQASLGDLHAALADFNQAIYLAPQSKIYNYRALIYFDLGKPVLAEQDIKKIFELGGSLLPQLRNQWKGEQP